MTNSKRKRLCRPKKANAKPKQPTARNRRELDNSFYYAVARHAGYRYKAGKRHNYAGLATPKFDDIYQFKKDARIMQNMQSYKRKLMEQNMAFLNVKDLKAFKVALKRIK